MLFAKLFLLLLLFVGLLGCVSTPMVGSPYGPYGMYPAAMNAGDNTTVSPFLWGRPAPPNMQAMQQQQQQPPQKQNFFRYGDRVIHLTDAFMDNPLMSFELSGLLAEKLATIVKINHLIMDRMPISIDDKWPEILRDYQLGLAPSSKDDDKKDEPESRQTTAIPTVSQSLADNSSMAEFTCEDAEAEFKKQLDPHLAKNFSFYTMFNSQKLISGLKEGGGISSLFSSPIETIKKTGLLKVSEEYGYSLLHAMNVLSRQPLGCKYKYPNAEFLDMHAQKTTDCTPIPKECTFFTMPLEEAILSVKNINSFIDTTVDTKCLRPVEGRAFESFTKAFHELLPSNARASLEKVDHEYLQVDEKLKSLTFEKESLNTLLELKDSDNETQKAGINFDEVSAKIDVVKKNIDDVQKQKSDITKLREKLYKDALKEIEVDPEKIKLAYKLKTITDYLDNSLTKVSATSVILTASIIWDVKNLYRLVISPMETIAKTSFLMSLSDNNTLNPQQTQELVKTRMSKLLSRAASLPVNIAAIAYGIKSQISFLAPYREYINTMVDLGVKKNLITLPTQDKQKKCIQLAKMPPFEVPTQPQVMTTKTIEPKAVAQTEPQKPEPQKPIEKQQSTTSKKSSSEKKTKTTQKTQSDDKTKSQGR